MSARRTSRRSPGRHERPWRRPPSDPSPRQSPDPDRRRPAQRAIDWRSHVTLTSDEVALTRPGSAEPGPLDDRLYDLVEARFRRLIRDNPVLGTFVGIHTEDTRLGDGSRDAVLDELEKDRRHLAAIEAIDPDGLSETARLE